MKPTTVTSILILLLSPLVFFAGCATTQTQLDATPQRKKAVFQAPLDKVWPMLVAEVATVYPPKIVEKDSGLIVTDWVSMPAGYNNMNAARYVYPPKMFLATWAGLRMNMKVIVVELEPGSTQVSVNCHYEAFEDNVMKSWVVVNSNGSVENAILTAIEQHLNPSL